MAANKNQTSTPSIASTDCKIFIVDDDQQQAQLMQAMAATVKLDTHIYTSSTEFLTVKISEFDIVILDLQMPEKDGIEIMRELADKNIKPSFILVSGFDERVLHSAKQLAESKQLKVVTTLTKPLKAKAFIDLLTRTVEQCRSYKSQHYSTDPAIDYTTQSNSAATAEKNLIDIEDLKLAIRRHQLVIHLQPKVCFQTLQLKGAEVLIRWQHPEKGLIPPNQFIPIAESHHLMNLLTEEVLRLVIKEHKKLSEQQINIKLAINLSAQNITDLSMPEKLEALVKHNHIQPDSFMLEVTESALMREISESLDILNRLRMKGFSLSIDDFGTGYSSLVKLYQAPFSELKIDQHFITRMTIDNDVAAIVKICILLAKELKMHVVAEGVESEETWNQLKKQGCDIAQGYYIAKPMPSEAFIAWIKNWNDEHTA